MRRCQAKPTVVTEPATSLETTSAVLNATVNPNGGTVSTCVFEYGLTTSFGSTAPCSTSPGSGTSPVVVSATIIGLTPATTYHFRITAHNPGGTSKGAGRKLITP